ncbi:MAG: response regulator [Pseudomonadota bacterium]
MIKHILIADDSAPIIYVVRSILKGNGYHQVTAVTNGKDAIQMLNESKYDALITDLNMPEIDGIKLINECRKKYKYMPIVVLSGMGSIDVAVEAMREGADDYVRKDTEDLSKTLIFVLERAAERKRLEQRINILEAILPICMYCKKIRRNDMDIEDSWVSVEEYFSERMNGIDFSHGICPTCAVEHSQSLQYRAGNAV